jgi:hypothetical protein
MKKKYKLLKRDKIEVNGHTLYRIEALRDFGIITKGNIGGYVANGGNLDYEGTCWVSGEARVYGDAKVYGNAEVSGDAWVHGDAWVYGDARVCGDARISFGYFHGDTFNLNDLIEYIACSLNVYPSDGKYILYKRVNKIKKGEYVSSHDNQFYYYDGKIAFVKDYDKSPTISCGKGLHVSTPFYWQDGDTLIAVEVRIKDIIACQEGKLRVKKLKVIGEIKQ